MSFEEWEAASRGMGGGKEDGDVGMDDSIHAVLQASSMMIEKRLMQLTEWVLRGPLKLKSPFQLSSNCFHTWLPEQRSPYSPPPRCAGCKPRTPGGWPSELLRLSKGLGLHTHIHYEHVLRMPLGGTAAFAATSYGKVLSRPALQGSQRAATSLTWITVASPS